MSDLNGDGVMHISVPDGRRKVQVGNGPVAELDLIATWHRWLDYSTEESRDDGDGTMRIPLAKVNEFIASLGLGTTADHNEAEALAFPPSLRAAVYELKKKVDPGEVGVAAPSLATDTDSTAAA